MTDRTNYNDLPPLIDDNNDNIVYYDINSLYPAEYARYLYKIVRNNMYGNVFFEGYLIINGIQFIEA